MSIVHRTGHAHAAGVSLVRALLVTLILGNVVGYALYRRYQKRPAPPPPLEAPKPIATPSPPPAKSNHNQALARAHRASGLAALEDGDYTLAVKEFTISLKMGESSNDMAELLRIAKDLQDRAAARAKEAKEAKAQPKIVEPPEPPRPAPAPPPQKAAARSKPKKSAAVASRSSSNDSEEPSTGMILVTSSPSGLLVEVDGRRVDFTPARIRTEPGNHSVALLQGDQRLYEKKVEVQEDGIHSIDADLTERLRPPQTETVAVPAPTRIAAADSAPEAESRKESPSAAAVPARNAADSRNTAGQTGEIHVVSLNVYGEVWINGQVYGPPPLVAKGIPVGSATVEIRVNGAVKRSKVVDIDAGQRAVLRIR